MLASCMSFDVMNLPALVIAATFVGLGLLILWKQYQPRIQGELLFRLSIAAMIGWLLTVLGEVQSQTLACKTAWATAAWPFIAFLPNCWALFLYHYSYGLQRSVNRSEVLFMALCPVIIAAMALTNPWHQLFYGPQTRLNADASAAIYDHGPLFFAAAGYLYTVMLAGFLVVLSGIRRARTTHRTYFLFLAALTLVPMAANLAYVGFGVTIAGFDPTPFAFSFVLLLLAWLTYTNQLFDLKAIAKDSLYFGFSNPVLILDDKGELIGANPRARALFNVTDRDMGREIGALPHLKGFSGLGRTGPEIPLPEDLTVGSRYLTAQVTPLRRPLGDELPMGYVLLFTDTTELRRANLRLEVMLEKKVRRLEYVSNLRDNLERQLMIDPLTGVQNRRGLEKTFTELSGRPRLQDCGLVLALIDLDHFKSINDTHGHATGDRVLKDFARLIRARVSPEQPVFRVGGEEFIILFPNARIEEVAALLDKFRTDLQVDAFTRFSDPVTVSFSAGLATHPRDGQAFGEVFNAADERLYVAKVAGRGKSVYQSDGTHRNGTDSA